MTLTAAQRERLRDLVAMGPLYRKPVDSELVARGLAEVWDTDSDGNESIVDTDAGHRRITCSHSY